MECHTGQVHSKFKVTSMFAVQMHVPFVSFQFRNLNILSVLYLQENPVLQNNYNSG